MKNLQYALLLGIIGFSLSNTTQTGERVTGTARERRQERQRRRLQHRPQSQQAVSTSQRRVAPARDTGLSAGLRRVAAISQQKDRPITAALKRYVEFQQRPEDYRNLEKKVYILTGWLEDAYRRGLAKQLTRKEIEYELQRTLPYVRSFSPPSSRKLEKLNWEYTRLLSNLVELSRQYNPRNNR